MLVEVKADIYWPDTDETDSYVILTIEPFMPHGRKDLNYYGRIVSVENHIEQPPEEKKQTTFLLMGSYVDLACGQVAMWMPGFGHKHPILLITSLLCLSQQSANKAP